MASKAKKHRKGFIDREHIHLLKAMVRLDARNRRLKGEKKTVTACPYCKKNGGKYDKRKHPKKEDCAGTGTATTWR